MGEPTLFSSIAEVHDYVGKPLGVSDWIEISQQRIDAFAEATGDFQWIHTDVERARRESPWKGTIAHGYLTLSLAPRLLADIVVFNSAAAVINTGCEKVRLATPVLAGSRLRMSGEIGAARNLPGGGVRVSFNLRFEVEGQVKPACTATVVFVYSE